MVEDTKKTVKKTLFFEKNREEFSIEIGIENSSEKYKKDTIEPFLDTLFQRAKEEILKTY